VNGGLGLKLAAGDDDHGGENGGGGGGGDDDNGGTNLTKIYIAISATVGAIYVLAILITAILNRRAAAAKSKKLEAATPTETQYK